MKSIKYELLGFSGLLGLALVLLALPSGEREREAIRAVTDQMVSQPILGER